MRGQRGDRRGRDLQAQSVAFEYPNARRPHVDADLRDLAGRNRLAPFKRVSHAQAQVAVAELAGFAVGMHVAEHRAELGVLGG